MDERTKLELIQQLKSELSGSDESKDPENVRYIRERNAIESLENRTSEAEKEEQAIDKILKKDEEARLKISEEMSTQTAAEAMASMKAAVDNLDIPKKPKKRSKDTGEKILKLYNRGWTKVKMAEELGIGLSTVNYHIQSLRDKGKI